MPSKPNYGDEKVISFQMAVQCDYVNVFASLDYKIVFMYADYSFVVGRMMEYQGTVSSAESLGRILQQARLLDGLSQRELAARLGISQRYVWEIEAGKPSIFMERLFAYMQETGVELTARIKLTDPDD